MPPIRLCTVADVKTAGNINVNYDYDETGLVRAIEAATVAVFTVTRRKWLLSEYTDRLPVPRSNVRGTFRLWTAVRPILIEPVAPKIFAMMRLRDTGVSLSSADYTIDATTGRIDIDVEALSPYQGGFVRVNYVGGLGNLPTDAETFDAPADLRHAAAMQAAFIYDRVVNSTVGVKQFAGKTGSTTYSSYANGLVPEAHALVAHYIRPLTGG